MNNKLDDLLENPTGYADFDNLSYWQIIFNSAIAIIGIGDFRGSAHMEPALTTCRLPARDLGCCFTRVARAGGH